MLSQGALEILSHIPWRPKELTTLRIPNVYLFHTKQVKPQSILTLLARVRKPLTLEMSGKEHTVPPGMYAPELQGTHVKPSCRSLHHVPLWFYGRHPSGTTGFYSRSMKPTSETPAFSFCNSLTSASDSLGVPCTHSMLWETAPLPHLYGEEMEKAPIPPSPGQ